MNNLYLYPNSLDGKMQGNVAHLGEIRHDYMSLYEPILQQRPRTLPETQLLTEDEKRLAAMVIDRERIDQQPKSSIPSLDLLRRHLEQERLRTAQVPKIHPEPALSSRLKVSLSPGTARTFSSSTTPFASSSFSLPRRSHSLPGDKMLAEFESMRRLTHTNHNSRVLERALRLIRDGNEQNRDAISQTFERERNNVPQTSDIFQHLSTMSRVDGADTNKAVYEKAFQEMKRNIKVSKKLEDCKKNAQAERDSKIPEQILPSDKTKPKSLKYEGGVRQKVWDSHFQRLVEFKKKNGHTMVPTYYPEDRALGNWVRNQRLNYKMGTLKEYRLSKLNEIGFMWVFYDRSTDRWDEMFIRLKKYKEEYGDTSVPLRYSADTQLGAWVNYQRTSHRQKKLAQDKVDKLEELGFEWNPLKHATSWEQMFWRLLAYKKCFGNVRVPFRYKPDPALGYWVSNQRAFYRKNRLTRERRILLESIGMFEKKEKTTMAALERLRMLQEQNKRTGSKF